MPVANTRREFFGTLGLSSAALPFVLNLPSLGFANQAQRKQRLVVIFTPNGVNPKTFWPDEQDAELQLKESLSPLAPLQDRTLTLHGMCDRIRGDGDNHMRGIGCLLTGTELFPGNIQGGSHTPAGWASGISIDQEIKNYLQASDSTRTRFGSLQFGVLVPDRADTWTRMVYAGPNQPMAPVDDPYQMFHQLYRTEKDRQALASIMDPLQDDLEKIRQNVSADDRHLLDQHSTFVRELEKQLQLQIQAQPTHAMPELEPGVKAQNDNMPTISRMQLELMVNCFANDFSRIATLQYTNSVGQARMRWLDIDEGHHTLSHEPDDNADAQDKLTRINQWFCQELAHLAQRLAETPEPGAPGRLLDNTLIVWTNELGKGNSHTLDNIPFVLVGNGLDFKMGRAVSRPRTPHNRLLLALAHGFGHHIQSFGNPAYCGDGPLNLG